MLAEMNGAKDAAGSSSSGLAQGPFSRGTSEDHGPVPRVPAAERAASASALGPAEDADLPQAFIQVLLFFTYARVNVVHKQSCFSD